MILHKEISGIEDLLYILITVTYVQYCTCSVLKILDGYIRYAYEV